MENREKKILLNKVSIIAARAQKKGTKRKDLLHLLPRTQRTNTPNQMPYRYIKHEAEISLFLLLLLLLLVVFRASHLCSIVVVGVGNRWEDTTATERNARQATPEDGLKTIIITTTETVVWFARLPRPFAFRRAPGTGYTICMCTGGIRENTRAQ